MAVVALEHPALSMKHHKTKKAKKAPPKKQVTQEKLCKQSSMNKKITEEEWNNAMLDVIKKTSKTANEILTNLKQDPDPRIKKEVLMRINLVPEQSRESNQIIQEIKEVMTLIRINSYHDSISGHTL